MPNLAITDLTVEYSSGGYVARPLDGLGLDALRPLSARDGNCSC